MEQAKAQGTMSEPLVIDMVLCPYCDKAWVREDKELVCDKCTPLLNVDLAVADLVTAVNQLEEADPSIIGIDIPAGRVAPGMAAYQVTLASTIVRVALA